MNEDHKEDLAEETKGDDNKANDNKSDKKTNAGMNVLKKIINTIRTESRELADSVTDSAGSRKIEYACEDAQSKLSHAKQALTDMMTKEKQAANKLDIINDKLWKTEALVVEAMSHSDEPAAMTHAIEVVDLELDRDYMAESLDNIRNNVGYLQSQLEQSERVLKDLERQLTMLRTTEKVQQATETIMSNIDGADSKMVSTKKSLERIREKQKNAASLHGNEEELANEYKQVRAASAEAKSIESEATSQHAKAVMNRLLDKKKSNDDG